MTSNVLLERQLLVGMETRPTDDMWLDNVWCCTRHLRAEPSGEWEDTSGDTERPRSGERVFRSRWSSDSARKAVACQVRSPANSCEEDKKKSKLNKQCEDSGEVKGLHIIRKKLNSAEI